MKHKRVILVFSLFFLSIIFSITSASLFYNRHLAVAVIFFILFLVSNIMVFRKGKKVAAVFGALALIFNLFVAIMGIIMYIGSPTNVTEQEKMAILENKKEAVDNLFNGYTDGNYSKFSRDLDDKMKTRYDKVQFLRLHDEFGGLVSKDCPNAQKDVMGAVVICEGDFENKMVRFDIHFSDNEIWELYINPVQPNVTVTVNSKNVTKMLQVLYNGTKVDLQPQKDSIFVILDLSIKNNEARKTKVHSYKFQADKYLFGSIAQDYDIGCDSLGMIELAANEAKRGCVIFSVIEGYTEGSVVIE